MQFHLEPLAKPARQFIGAQARFLCPQIPQMPGDLLGEFVRTPGTTLVGQESFQAFLLKVGLSLINGGARQAELTGSLRNRVAVLLERAQGFVFELHQILRIKEVGLLKEGMANPVGARVEGAAVLQGLAFGAGIGGHKCKSIYASY